MMRSGSEIPIMKKIEQIEYGRAVRGIVAQMREKGNRTNLGVRKVGFG